jgi:hypothetical protein
MMLLLVAGRTPMLACSASHALDAWERQQDEPACLGLVCDSCRARTECVPLSPDDAAAPALLAGMQLVLERYPGWSIERESQICGSCTKAVP